MVESADTRDLKSLGSNTVPVQVWLPAPNWVRMHFAFGLFLFLWENFRCWLQVLFWYTQTAFGTFCIWAQFLLCRQYIGVSLVCGSNRERGGDTSNPLCDGFWNMTVVTGKSRVTPKGKFTVLIDKRQTWYGGFMLNQIFFANGHQRCFIFHCTSYRNRILCVHEQVLLLTISDIN